MRQQSSRYTSDHRSSNRILSAELGLHHEDLLFVPAASQVIVSATHQLNSLLRAFLLTTFGLLLGSVERPLHAASLNGVRPLLVECFRSAHAASCDRALLRTEAMQRRAADRELYPCQTLLLGLQAEMVMAQLAEQRGAKALETMREAERLCAGL